MSRERNRRREYREDERYDEYYENDNYYRRRRRHPRSADRYRQPRRKRSIWPWLLLGCASAIVLLVVAAGITVFATLRSFTPGGISGISGGMKTYTHEDTQPVPLKSLTQLTIHNTVGNISVTVDPNAASPTVMSTKKVQASSQDEANQEFTRIAVQVQQPADTALAVTTTLPGKGTIFNKSGDTVDLAITLPPGVVSTTSLFTFKADTSFGDVTIDGLNGLLTIIDHDQGNVTVRNAQLSPYSCLEAGQGNVTFDGTFDTTSNPTPQPVCTDTTPAQEPVYRIHTGEGNLDITMPDTTNVYLRADTNVGTINSEFTAIANAITRDGNSSSVPKTALCSTCTTQPTALLVLSVSTGNINLHKKM